MGTRPRAGRGPTIRREALESMSKRWHMLRQDLLPTPGTIALLLGALGLLVIGFSCALLFALTADVDDPAGAGTFVFSFVVLPIILLLLLIGSLRDKRPAPRAVLWFLGALLVGASGLVTAMAIAADQEMGVGGGGAVFVLFCAPLSLVLFVPSIYYAAKAAPRLRATLAAERERRALEMIAARGHVGLSELASELALDPERVHALMDALLSSGRLEGLLDAQASQVYSADALAERRRRLMAIVHARGVIQVAALAEEMGVSLGVLREWIYQLVERAKFTGYINWEDGLLYSREAQQLRDADRCPHCSGAMSLVGKGIVRCAYCGAEVFL